MCWTHQWPCAVKPQDTKFLSVRKNVQILFLRAAFHQPTEEQPKVQAGGTSNKSASLGLGKNLTLTQIVLLLIFNQSIYQ